jgi:hypothetical protein
VTILLVQQKGDDNWQINEELLPELDQQGRATAYTITVAEFHMEGAVKKPDQIRGVAIQLAREQVQDGVDKSFTKPILIK